QPTPTLFPYTTLFRSDPADQVLFGVPFEDIAASIGIVPSHAFEDLTERQVVLSQPIRVHEHLILFDKPSVGVYVRHAWRALEKRSEEHTSELQSRSDL